MFVLCQHINDVFISYTEAMTVIDVDKELGIAKVWYVQRRVQWANFLLHCYAFPWAAACQ